MAIAFPWGTALKVGLRLVLKLSQIVQEKQLLDAGAAQESARIIAETGQLLGIGRQIVSEIEAMSDQDLDDALAKATEGKTP